MAKRGLAWLWERWWKHHATDHPALNTQVTEPATRLTAADAAIAEELARQAANAIENARLYEGARQRERESRLLAEAGRLFNASLELDELLPWVVELAVAEIGEAACIYLYDENEDKLTIAASSFASCRRTRRMRAPRPLPMPS